MLTGVVDDGAGNTYVTGGSYGRGFDCATLTRRPVADHAALRPERRPAADFTLLTTVGRDVTSYVDQGLARNTAYSYRVRAFDAGGPSAIVLAIVAMIAIVVVIPGARAAAVDAIPGAGWPGSKVIALRSRAIGLVFAGCVVVLVLAEVVEDAVEPPGRLADHLEATYPGMRDARPPLELSIELDDVWPSEDQRYGCRGAAALRARHIPTRAASAERARPASGPSGTGGRWTARSATRRRRPSTRRSPSSSKAPRSSRPATGAGPARDWSSTSTRCRSSPRMCRASRASSRASPPASRTTPGRRR